MILVVDDLRTFPFEATYARTVYEARKIFVGMERDGGRVVLDELWLDHDLGGEATIRPLVLQIEERCYMNPPESKSHPRIGRVVIHSANSVGVKYIRAALERYYPVVQVDAAAYGCTSPEW